VPGLRRIAKFLAVSEFFSILKIFSKIDDTRVPEYPCATWLF
jgi:hypothetical protein